MPEEFVASVTLLKHSCTTMFPFILLYDKYPFCRVLCHFTRYSRLTAEERMLHHLDHVLTSIPGCDASNVNVDILLVTTGVAESDDWVDV